MIAESTLLDLAPAYLPEKVRNAPGQTQAAALEWAGAEFGGRIRLLEPAAGGWRVFDYLLDHLSVQDTPIPEQSWAAAVDAAHADPARALTLGYRAYLNKRTDLADKL
jgi:hypothetical protein